MPQNTLTIYRYLLLISIRNFAWHTLGNSKSSSEGKGPQKTGGQGRSEGNGYHSCPGVGFTVHEVWPDGHHFPPLTIFIDKIDSNFLYDIFLVLYIRR